MKENVAREIMNAGAEPRVSHGGLEFIGNHATRNKVWQFVREQLTFRWGMDARKTVDTVRANDGSPSKLKTVAFQPVPQRSASRSSHYGL